MKQSSRRHFAPVLRAVLTAVLVSTATFAASVPAGFISWDVNFPGNAGQFDIVNQTGPNASVLPDTTFPISTLLSMSGLGLSVTFSNGVTTTYSSSYFSLSADGESFNGSPIAIGGTNPLPTMATLTGNFSPLTITLTTGGSMSIVSGFSATITPSSGTRLSDGDFAIINATTGVSGVPEPGTWAMLLAGLAGIAVYRLRFRPTSRITAAKALSVLSVVALAQMMGGSASAQRLNSATVPDSGVAGVNDVNIVGNGFPVGTITPANVLVTFSTTCGGAASATTNALSVRRILGATSRIDFMIPSSLATGTYFIALSDAGTGGDVAFDTRGTSCSKLSVTRTNPTLSACVPTSSLGVLSPAKAGKVTAYVPNGFWGSTTTGVQAVDIEGGTSKTSIATPGSVNSCSSNPATGQTVCTANTKDVYLISGTTLNTTLTSGASGVASFSGGTCQNCGVAMNALSNKAVIAIGLSGSPTSSGIQLLDLNTNTFAPPVPATSGTVSEDISIDPTRNLILSASENGVYGLFQIQSDGTTIKEFGGTPNTSLELDSSGEDCTTGIAISVGEFSNSVYLADLTQAVFTSGTPSTYTAPHSTTTLVSSSYRFSAGLSAVTVAPGSSHLAVATGEFGGNTFAVLKLPSASGTGTPAILDYAVAAIPASTTCGTFNAGLDPHTVTAYTSPNDGKAYALFANSPPPSCLARIDLDAVLGATRNPGTHDVSAANFPASAVTFYATR